MRLLAFLSAFLMPLTLASGHGAYHDELARLGFELEKNPSDHRLVRERAALHLSHEDWQAALVDLEHVDRMVPLGDSGTGGLRGQALNQAGQWAAARAVLSQHLEKYPGDCAALFQRGRALSHLTELKLALTDYQAALLSSDSLWRPEPLLEIADVTSQLEGAPTAAAFLEQAMKRTGPDPALLQRAVELYLAAGNADAALLHLQVLQKLMPRPEPVMARRARILAQAGRADSARAAWSALRAHLLALPNLERGAPELSRLLQESQLALGEAVPAPVIAPPTAFR